MCIHCGIYHPLCGSLRSSAREGVSVEALVSELKGSLQWSESCVAVVRHIWKEEGPALCSMPREALSVGQVRSVYIGTQRAHAHAHTQLVSMDWQLGMAMSSSSCRSLNSPYITLQLNVADPSGSLRQKTLQLTVAEFQVRLYRYTDIAKLMVLLYTILYIMAFSL